MPCTEPGIINLQILKIPVTGPGDIDTLFIFTGTALVQFDGQKPLDTCTLQITLWPTIQAPTYGVFHPTTYLALSSVANLDDNNPDWDFEIGSGQDSLIDPQTSIIDGTLKLIATLICDENVELTRVDFQVCAPVSSVRMQ